jgi:uncharacterized protein YggU (UPF0235/DUF167 family)
MAIEFISQPGGVSFKLKVVPGASRNRVIGEYDGALKVSVTLAPEGGRANAAVIELLAQALRISPAKIRMTHGRSSPRKQVFVQGMTADSIRRILQVLPIKTRK